MNPKLSGYKRLIYLPNVYADIIALLWVKTDLAASNIDNLGSLN